MFKRKYLVVAAIVAAAQGLVGLAPAVAQSPLSICSDPVTGLTIALLPVAGAAVRPAVLPTAAAGPARIVGTARLLNPYGEVDEAMVGNGYGQAAR